MRFVLIGGINTVVGYALFVIVHLTLGRYIGDLLTLYTSYIPATIVAFALHRHFTYRVTGTGNVVIDFFRFQSVYVVSLLINSVALVVLVQVAKVPTLLAQALIVVVTTLVSYFGHKFFSFRRPGGPKGLSQSSSPDVTPGTDDILSGTDDVTPGTDDGSGGTSGPVNAEQRRGQRRASQVLGRDDGRLDVVTPS